MKDNAINKIYKITNNALGISLIVTQPYYAERRFVKPGHFGAGSPAKAMGGKTAAGQKSCGRFSKICDRRSRGLRAQEKS